MNDKNEQQHDAPSGVEGGRRPTGSPEGARRTTEVLPKAARRQYTAEYKRKIVEQASKCREAGQVGALLRREGIYSSQLANWRRKYDQGALKALSQSRGRRPTKTTTGQQMIRLQKDNTDLKEQLRKAHLIIDVQKKISALLFPSQPEDQQELTR